MNAIFDLKKTMIVALVALACSTACASCRNRCGKEMWMPLQEAPQACEKSKMLEIKKMRSDKP